MLATKYDKMGEKSNTFRPLKGLHQIKMMLILMELYTFLAGWVGNIMKLSFIIMP